MIGFNQNRSRFYLSEECYFDLNSNNIVDTNNGQPVKYTPIDLNQLVILKMLIQNYPLPATADVIADAVCDAYPKSKYAVDDVRKDISRLKKKHPMLLEWIPNAQRRVRVIINSKGEDVPIPGYRLQQPVISSETEKTAPVQEQSDGFDHDADTRSNASERRQIDDSLYNPRKIDEIDLSDSAVCTLKSPHITTRPHYVSEAREDTFRELDEAFCNHHVVFLQGIGGIGKSEAAKNWAIKKKQEGMFDTVVFAQLNTEKNNSNVMSLINDDTTFVLTGDFRNRGDVTSADREESEEEYFHRKLAKIMQISNEKTLIIIDNYDIADPYLSKLYAGNYCLLITTRNKYEGVDYPFITVGEITNIAHRKTIFFNYLDNERSDISYNDPYIEKLFELVSNHTLAIEIIAKSLADSVEDTPESLYKKMIDVGMHAIDGEIESYVSQKELSPFECIKILFDLSRLESDSDFEYKVQVLTFMALMPTRGIDLWLFKKWSNNKTNRAANALIKKSWLRKDAVDGIPVISMHPIIKETVWHELKPSVDKCRDYLLQMARTAHVAWHREYRENLIIANAVMSVLERFYPPKGEELCIFEPLINMLWQVGQFEKAIEYGRLLYNSCVNVYGKNSMEAGIAAKSLGGCYFNCRRLEKSIYWYKCGLESMLASGIEKSYDIALAYEKVARCYTWECNRDFALAEENFNKSMMMFKQLLGEIEEGKAPHYTLSEIRPLTSVKIQTSIGGLKTEIGRMNQLMGNYEEARRLAKEANQIINEFEPEDSSSIAYTYFDQGVCLYNIAIKNPDGIQAVEQLNEALVLLKKAMESNMQMRGELAVDIADNFEMIGDVHRALGQTAEAKKEYQAAVHALENLFGVNCKEGDKIRTKINSLDTHP